jgi:hypothetical protein
VGWWPRHRTIYDARVGVASATRFLPRALAVLISTAFLGGCGSAVEPSGDAQVSDAPEQVFASDAQITGPWSPIPFRAPPPLVTAADQGCRRGMKADLPAQVPLVVLDLRGQGRLQAWYAGPNDVATCNDLEIQPDGTVQWTGPGSAGSGGDEQVLERFQILILDSSAAGNPIFRSYVGGRAGSDIGSIWITAQGVQSVRATLANGWFAAWVPGAWPRGAHVKGLAVNGIEVADVPLQ